MITYGPSHFGSSLPELSVWGLHRRTRLPTLRSFSLTFRSLQDLVSSLYFCKLATAFSLSDSNKSFSPASLRHDGASAIVRKLLCLISSGSTVSAPNNNQNGVKLVALQIVVLWLHTALPFAFEYFLDCLKNQGIGSFDCSIRLWVV
jgi:hypothetical protein